MCLYTLSNPIKPLSPFTRTSILEDEGPTLLASFNPDNLLKERISGSLVVSTGLNTEHMDGRGGGNERNPLTHLGIVP